MHEHVNVNVGRQRWTSICRKGLEKDLSVHVVVVVDVAVDVDDLCKIRLRSGPFEGPSTGKSPACRRIVAGVFSGGSAKNY